MPFEPGQQVGRFRVMRLIAQGGMAEVYGAEQELTVGIFRPAALKVIRPEYSESPDFREMFLDEARTACTLSHPNIVHIYEVGEFEGLLYMAMELVSGETLSTVARALRKKGERFTDEALLAVGVFTCAALEAVHALTLPGEGHLNLVHRDVSPHNLLLSASGSLKLIDFGIAKAATNRNLTMPGVTKGKAGYFSPEQAMGKSLDGRSDLFSLGVTLYKLAFGATPFDDHATPVERNHALVRGQWNPLEKVCGGLPKGLYEVVNRALMLRPDERYPSAKAMREALEQVALESGIPVGPSSLSGYVDDKGELTGSPSQRRVALQYATQMRSEEVTVPEANRRSKREKRRFAAVSVSVALAAVAVGAGLVFLLAKEPPPPPPPAPVATVPLAVPTQTELSPIDIEIVPSKPKASRPAKPPVAAAPALPVPAGEGRLRIGAVPDGTVTVGPEKWGTTPVDRKVSSGRYVVSIVGANGKRGQCQATVMPDRTTILIYNFDTGTCK
ncbi:MAG: serine/threonine protein kinase [Myxococcota bacterium]